MRGDGEGGGILEIVLKRSLVAYYHRDMMFII